MSRAAPERVGPDIFQSGPIIRCGARAPLCVLLNTGNDGMFAGLSGGTASLRPLVTEGSTQLSPVRECATAGQTTHNSGSDYRTIVWSVVPLGLDSCPEGRKRPEWRSPPIYLIWS